MQSTNLKQSKDYKLENVPTVQKSQESQIEGL